MERVDRSARLKRGESVLSSLMNELDPHLEGPGGPLDGGLDVDGLAMLDGLAVDVDGLAMPESPTLDP